MLLEQVNQDQERDDDEEEETYSSGLDEWEDAVDDLLSHDEDQE